MNSKDTNLGGEQDHIEEQCPWLIHSRLLLFDLVNEWYASQWYGFVRGCSKSTDSVNVASNLNGWFSSFHSMAGRGYCHQLNWCILVFVRPKESVTAIPIKNPNFTISRHLSLKQPAILLYEQCTQILWTLHNHCRNVPQSLYEHCLNIVQALYKFWPHGWQVTMFPKSSEKILAYK